MSLKRKAHDKIWRAKHIGTLVPEPCTICRVNMGVDTHHQDYAKPLEVDWLCKSCHRLVSYAIRDVMRACGVIVKFMSEVQWSHLQ